jgi:EmrB/QacA subfamily drug resistance transporter
MRPAVLTAFIIATALFMENMDGTVLSTSLPAIAADFHEDPIVLKLALTSYMLTLAVFIPASGWVADKLGARTVFCSAIVVFTLGSILCGASTSLPTLIGARIFQGLGGAMMVPVGRLVLLRSVSKSEMVNALAYLTVPALIGPVVGPPLGGFITTYFHWRWIFWINAPIGLLGVLLALKFIENIRERDVARFDFKGFALSGAGLLSLIFGLTVIGRGLAPAPVVVAMVLCGAALLALYVRHARGNPDAILDLGLLKTQTFMTAVVGGFLFRLGIGALPFLLPLLLQIGFGLSPFRSGLVTFGSAIGALSMKTLASQLIRRYGFRNILIINAVLSSAFLIVCMLFTASTPLTLILIILIVGGFFRSLQFTAIGTMAYAEIDAAQTSRATTLVAVNQQLAISAGVAVGAFVVEMTQRLHGGGELVVRDFAPAFLVVGLISLSSTWWFYRLPHDAGHEVSGRRVPEIPGRSPVEAVEKQAIQSTIGIRDQRLGWRHRSRPSKSPRCGSTFPHASGRTPC